MPALQIGYTFGRWWRNIDLRLRWLAVVLLTGSLGVTLYQAWVGYDVVRSVGVFVLMVTALSLAFWLIGFAAKAVRRLLARLGVLESVRRVGNVVWLALSVCAWLAMGAFMLYILWPYLSLSPTTSWYALKNGIPAEDTLVYDKPHDCEFSTAPLGAKNCHYEPQLNIFNADGVPGKQKTLIVEWKKVTD